MFHLLRVEIEVQVRPPGVGIDALMGRSAHAELVMEPVREDDLVGHAPGRSMTKRDAMMSADAEVVFKLAGAGPLGSALEEHVTDRDVPALVGEDTAVDVTKGNVSHPAIRHVVEEDPVVAAFLPMDVVLFAAALDGQVLNADLQAVLKPEKAAGPGPVRGGAAVTRFGFFRMDFLEAHSEQEHGPIAAFPAEGEIGRLLDTDPVHQPVRAVGNEDDRCVRAGLDGLSEGLGVVRFAVS